MMEMETDILAQRLEKDMGKTTTLLGFLITQPQIATSLTGADERKLLMENIIKVKTANLWSDSMLKHLREKDKSEGKDFDNIIKMIDTCTQVKTD